MIGEERWGEGGEEGNGKADGEHAASPELPQYLAHWSHH